MVVQDKTWVAVGNINDIPRQGARRLINGSTTIAVFRTTDDQVFALEDKCPYKDGPLSEGIVHGRTVSCPITNWVISLETGEAQGADEGQAMSFPIRLEGERILVGL